MRVTQVAIVGLGLIGGSIAYDLRKSGFARKFVGVDCNQDHCEAARNLKIVDEIQSLEEAIQSSDLVILAIPVNRVMELLPQVLTGAGATTTVVDMGSTKQLIGETVRAHARRNILVASHPMAGTENSGPAAALEGLFFEKTAILCDCELSGPTHVEKVQDLYKALGARLLFMSSREHDLQVAYVSHLSHISSFALANTILDKEKNVSTIFDLASGGFSSTVRLAKSSPEMWSPIFEQNRSAVIAALESYIDHLKEFHQTLVEKKFGDTRDLIVNANRIRRVLQTIDEKGRGHGTKK